MSEFLYELYNQLYTPLTLTKQKSEIYKCHHKLIDTLNQPERKLLLTIMDRKDEIADELAFDSFVYGFKVSVKSNSV